MNYEQLLNKIEELEKKLALLEADSTIPFNVEQAFRGRLRIATSLSASAKAATSESIPVNTGAGTLVQLFPDAFVQTTIGGVTYYLPAYT